MSKFKIEHDRPNCIGCAACAAVFPERWTMNDDGKSDVVEGKKDEKGWEHLDFEQADFERHKEAADSCPVNVIHIVDKEKNNTRII